MTSDKRVTFPPPPLFLYPGDVPRFSDQPKVHRPDDEGCPNENPSVDDATGYSKEEEEATSASCEEFL